MISMFAIPNCNTVKKARDFLEKNKVEYQFIDFKKTPPTKEQIQEWSDFLGELPVNKKGLTYKKYKEQYESLPTSQKIDFIIDNTSMIKRPVLMINGQTVAVGFNEDQYIDMLGQYSI